MPVMFWPIFAACVSVILSLLGLYQRRWGALRLAVVLGWLGPLPGFVLAFHLYEWDLAALASAPIETLFYGLLPYAFAVPMFGSYCFVVGILGGRLINRFTRDPAPKWAQPLAIVVISGLAAVPVVLLSGGVSEEFGRYALISSAFWCIVILAFRRKIFTPKVMISNACH